MEIIDSVMLWLLLTLSRMKLRSHKTQPTCEAYELLSMIFSAWHIPTLKPSYLYVSKKQRKQINEMSATGRTTSNTQHGRAKRYLWQLHAFCSSLRSGTMGIEGWLWRERRRTRRRRRRFRRKDRGCPSPCPELNPRARWPVLGHLGIPILPLWQDPRWPKCLYLLEIRSPCTPGFNTCTVGKPRLFEYGNVSCLADSVYTSGSEQHLDFKTILSFLTLAFLLQPVIGEIFRHNNRLIS